MRTVLPGLVTILVVMSSGYCVEPSRLALELTSDVRTLRLGMKAKAALTIRGMDLGKVISGGRLGVSTEGLQQEGFRGRFDFQPEYEGGIGSARISSRSMARD